MTAVVFRRNADFFVGISHDSVNPTDIAGPFDDEHEAVCAAQRATADGGSVVLSYGADWLTRHEEFYADSAREEE